MNVCEEGKAEKESPIEEVLEVASHSVDELEKSIDALRDKLSPILISKEEKSEQQHKEPRPACAIEARITVIAQRIIDQKIKVLRIRQELQV